jgi:hypothetical protein
MFLGVAQGTLIDALVPRTTMSRDRNEIVADFDPITNTYMAKFEVRMHDAANMTIMYNRKHDGHWLEKRLEVSPVFSDEREYFILTMQLRVFLTDTRIMCKHTYNLNDPGNFSVWLRQHGQQPPNEVLRQQCGFPKRPQQVLPVKALSRLFLHGEMGTGLREVWIDLLRSIDDPGIRKWLVDEELYKLHLVTHRPDALKGTVPIDTPSPDATPPGVPPPPPRSHQHPQETANGTTTPMTMCVPDNDTVHASGGNHDDRGDPNEELVVYAHGGAACRTNRGTISEDLLREAMEKASVLHRGWHYIEIVAQGECALLGYSVSNPFNRATVKCAVPDTDQLGALMSELHAQFDEQITKHDENDRQIARTQARRNLEDEQAHDQLVCDAASTKRKRLLAEEQQKLEDQQVHDSIIHAAASAKRKRALEDEETQTAHELKLVQLGASPKKAKTALQCTKERLQMSRMATTTVKAWNREHTSFERQQQLFVDLFPDLSVDLFVSPPTTTVSPPSSIVKDEPVDTDETATVAVDTAPTPTDASPSNSNNVLTTTKVKQAIASKLVQLPAGRIRSFAIALDICEADPSQQFFPLIDRLHGIIEDTTGRTPFISRERTAIKIRDGSTGVLRGLKAWILPSELQVIVNDELLGRSTDELRSFGNRIHIPPPAPTNDTAINTSNSQQAIDARHAIARMRPCLSSIGPRLMLVAMGHHGRVCRDEEAATALNRSTTLTYKLGVQFANLYRSTYHDEPPKSGSHVYSTTMLPQLWDHAIQWVPPRADCVQLFT